ncbi:MAG: polysaccharide biosynthesis C-terminal domain-containing protein [Myxococcales bacterium]|nr:polysaccharide biosynthesis C-terminal domain-containing protein [Myxococcales bacterium]
MAEAMPACAALGDVPVATPHSPAGACVTHTAPLGRELWALGGPAIAHMLLVTVVFAVQRLVIGHYDSLALASLQVSALLVWTLYSLFGAVGVAALGLIGRAIGAGDRARAAAVARLSLQSAAALGVLAALPLGLFARPICGALFPSASGPVLDEAERYLLVVAPALPFALVEGAAAACLQGAGDTRTPLYAAAAGNVLHVVVAATLVGGAFGLPELGVRGAALGAALAFMVQALWLCHALYRTGSPLELRAPATRRRTVSRTLARLSWPLLGDKLLYHAGDLAFVAIIGVAGASAMAANQALLSVEAACFLTAEGLGGAAATLVAH